MVSPSSQKAQTSGPSKSCAFSPAVPGAAAGIHEGDIIAGIDEEPAADITLNAVRDLFRQVGHKYKLVIERNGKTQEVVIEMKRLV